MQAEDVEHHVIEYALQIAKYHHERIDGAGYPEGLCDDEIPLCAKVVALADVFDALTSSRSYKEAFSQDVAIQMISNGMCGAFDEELVTCLMRVVNHRSFSYSGKRSSGSSVSVLGDHDRHHIRCRHVYAGACGSSCYDCDDRTVLSYAAERQDLYSCGSLYRRQRR